jgi:hypothetical protein
MMLTVGMSSKSNESSGVGVKKPGSVKRLSEGEVVSLGDGEPVCSDAALDVCADRVFDSSSSEVETIEAESDEEVKA